MIDKDCELLDIIPYKFQDKLENSVINILSSNEFSCIFYTNIIFNDRYDIEKVIEYLKIGKPELIRFYDRTE